MQVNYFTLNCFYVILSSPLGVKRSVTYFLDLYNVCIKGEGGGEKIQFLLSRSFNGPFDPFVKLCGY